MSISCTARPPSKAQDSRLWILGAIVLLATWIVLYRQLEPFSRWFTAQLPLQPGTHLADAVAFFVYDTPCTAARFLRHPAGLVQAANFRSAVAF